MRLARARPPEQSTGVCWTSAHREQGSPLSGPHLLHRCQYLVLLYKYCCTGVSIWYFCTHIQQVWTREGRTQLHRCVRICTFVSMSGPLLHRCQYLYFCEHIGATPRHMPRSAARAIPSFLAATIPIGRKPCASSSHCMLSLIQTTGVSICTYVLVKQVNRVLCLIERRLERLHLHLTAVRCQNLYFCTCASKASGVSRCTFVLVKLVRLHLHLIAQVSAFVLL